MDFSEKQQKLPESVKNFFHSDEPRLELERSCYMYGIKDNEIQNIAGEVGLIFVGDINLINLPKIILEKLGIENRIAFGLAYEINKRIFNRFPEYFKDSQRLLEEWSAQKANPVIREDEAWRKVLAAEPWIQEMEEEKRRLEQTYREQEIKNRANLVNLPIPEALKKYPELGEQLITSSHIKLQNFPDPVRPSLKNWLFDYTFNAGHEAHNSMIRGSFLFQNENAKRLPAPDRQKLAFVLKAYDENSLVTVNATTKQIVFPIAPRSLQPPMSRPESSSRPASAARPFPAAPVNSYRAPIESRQHINHTYATSNPSIPSANLNFTPTPKDSMRQPIGETDGTLVRGFSSPQKMPFENRPNGPQPIRINPPGSRRDSRRDFGGDGSNLNRNPKPLSKNIVNLKE